MAAGGFGPVRGTDNRNDRFERIFRCSAAKVGLRCGQAIMSRLVSWFFCMSPLRPLFALFVLCLLPWTAIAQDDPFGGAGPNGGADPFGAPVVDGAAATPSSPVDESPLTQQLLELAGRGFNQRATAIASLVRTDRWQEADRLLTGVPGMGLDEASLASMFREIGPALYLRMKQSDQLTDPAKAALDQMAQAQLATAESQERIRRAIDGLDDPSIDVRLAASRTLLGGGNTSIAELVAAAVSPSPSSHREIILRALVEFEQAGLDAMRQLALYGSADVRTRALQAIGAMDRSHHVADFMTGVYASDASDSERQVAMKQLESLGNANSTRERAIQFLDADFQQLQTEAKQIDHTDQTTTVWIVNEDGQSVSPKTSTTMLAAYREVVDAGNRLRRVGGLPETLAGDVLSADMAYRVMVDPDWGDPGQIDEVRRAYGTASSPAELLSAISRSLESGDDAAAIGLIRLVDAANATGSDRTILLTSSGPRPTSLVMAAANSDPQVRYEAALAAEALAQGGPYAGSSLVRKTLAEMSLLGDKPTAILVETRPEVVVRLETILSQLGYDTRVVRNVAQLQRAIDQGGDLRLILSKIELSDLPPIEMVDLVRRVPRGRDLPILFYGPEDPALLWKRWDAPTVLIEMPSSAAALEELMDADRRRRRIPSLSVIDRQRYRAAAAPKPAS